MKKLEKLLDNLLDIVSPSENDRIEIKSNLLSSIYLDFLSCSISSNNKYIKGYPLDKNTSFVEFEIVVNKIRKELIQNNFNFENTLRNSTIDTLNEFLTKVESHLTTQERYKISELMSKFNILD